MKIGILTLPFNNNYGGFLQGYALMTALKERGHDVWFIDLYDKPQKSIVRRRIETSKNAIKKFLLKKDIYSISTDKNESLARIVTWQNTQPFVDKYLTPKISPVYSSNELRYITSKINFDAYIVGSDQVWRPKYMNHFIKTVYLDFLEGKNAKRISYAASFGVDKWEYNTELTKECADLIKQFDAVTVRENSGVDLCKKYFNVDAKQVVDPTLLLSREHYIKLIEDARIERSESDLLCYVLDENDKIKHDINYVADKLALKPFKLGLKIGEKKVNDRILEPIEYWLRVFYDAKFIITDSFHGMVFSIIFNKPFLIYGNEARGLSRFTSLLELFSLTERLILPNANIDESILRQPIDFSEVNRIIEMQKNKVDLILKELEI